MIPDFKALYGLDLPEYQLHIRYLLSDSQTGYRNNYKKLSIKISVLITESITFDKINYYLCYQKFNSDYT